MKRWNNFQIAAVVVSVIILFTIVLSYQYAGASKEPVLPYFGPNAEAGEPHYVSDFKLIDQNNEVITQEVYKNKIYVADFFFTTCLGICPIMTEEMIRVYKAYGSNPEVLIISHTVDPEHDTPEVLARYAKNRNLNSDKWHFVTGDKKQIYDLARYSYLVDATEGDAGPNDFVHTENFALVDKEGRIRGYYDGTDSVEVKKLIGDIKLLLEE